VIAVQLQYILYLKDNFIPNNKICIEFMRKYCVFIVNTKFLFPLKWNILLFELVFQCILVNNLKKTIPKIIVDFHTCSYYFIGFQFVD
jgi:hypothetical protein